MGLCWQCDAPLSFGLYRYCSNECQEEYHISNSTHRAKEMRAQRNSKRYCFDWNLGRECTEHCAKYGFRHACQGAAATVLKEKVERGSGAKRAFDRV